MESVGSGDCSATFVAMDTSGHYTKLHHMGGDSSHVHLYHNYSLNNFFNLMSSDDFRSGILCECTNMRAEMQGSGGKSDWDITKYPEFTPF